MNEITLDAIIPNLNKVTAFIEEILEGIDCPLKAVNQIEVAVDEIFSNISNYAYGTNVGKATVIVEIIEEPLAAKISFYDSGVPYNPLEKDDPDVTLSADERQVGGLGIFMVKKLMDEVSYEYKEGKNILTIRKILN